jgi:O-antigen biosynthesis protein WbqP
MIYRVFFKRDLDIFFSLAAMLLLSPLLLIVALLIKVFDPGPVIFRQKRVGINGEPFVFYKFRSMPVNTVDIPSDKIGALKIRRVGRFIRRTSIDELPQLFNILRGDMSIVGPRPPIASQIELIGLRRSNGALLCRPGLTGLAQIRSFDGMTVLQKAEIDGVYARSITLLGDIKIILGTFTYLVKPPPVY